MTRTEYETKTVKYREDGPGAYTILITRIDTAENELLGAVGYGGVQFLFYLVESKTMYDDPYVLVNDILATNDDLGKRLFIDIHEHFDKLEDGKAVNRDDIRL